MNRGRPPTRQNVKKLAWGSRDTPNSKEAAWDDEQTQESWMKNEGDPGISCARSPTQGGRGDRIKYKKKNLRVKYSYSTNPLLGGHPNSQTKSQREHNDRLLLKKNRGQ